MAGKYTDTEIIAALKASRGVIAAAAKAIGCSRWVITKRAKTNEKNKELLAHPRGGSKGKQQFTDKKIIAAVREAEGMLSVAARALGCSRRTIEERANTSQAVRDAINEEREFQLDTAESELNKAIKAGKPWAITYKLSTLGKKRGYTKAQTIDMNQTITVDLPDSFNWNTKD